MSWRPLVEVLPVLDTQAPPPGYDSASVSYAGELAAEHNEAPQPDAESGLMPLPQPRQAQRSQAALRPSRIGNAQGSAEELAAVREDARREGYEEGAALGRAEQEALCLRYRNAIEELVDAREQTIKACEADFVRLALTIAREVLLCDAPLREEFAARMAEQAVAALGGQEAVTLRLNAGDAAALQRDKPELTRRPDVRIIEDASIALGGVVAEGGRGRLDATIEARLTQMRDKLLQDVPAGTGP